MALLCCAAHPRCPFLSRMFGGWLGRAPRLGRAPVPVPLGGVGKRKRPSGRASRRVKMSVEETHQTSPNHASSTLVMPFTTGHFLHAESS